MAMSHHRPAVLVGLKLLQVAEKAHDGLLVGKGEYGHALVDGAGVAGLYILAADHEVNGTTKNVGYLPGGSKRYPALGTLDGTLVAGIGGAGDVKDFREVLCRAVAGLAAQALKRPLADARTCGIWRCGNR